MNTTIKTIVLAAAVSLSLGAQAQGFFKKAPTQEPAAVEAPSSVPVKEEKPAAQPAPVVTPAPMPKPTPAVKPATAADAPKPVPKPVKPQTASKSAEKDGKKKPPVGKAMKPPADSEVITITRTRTLREVPLASQVPVEGGADPVAACEADGVSGFLAKGCAGLRCIKDKYKGHSFCLKLAADAEARRAAEQSNYR